MVYKRRKQPLSLARVWVRSNIITTVLIVFILLSLLLHALTIGALVRVRGTVQRQLDISTEQLNQMSQQSIRYNFPVDQTLTIDTTIAISETVLVPLNIHVAITETITLPIDTPLGQIPISVPLDLKVPISDTIEVPINKNLPFKADIPIQTTIPIDIDLRQPPLGDIFQQFQDALQDLRNRL